MTINLTLWIHFAAINDVLLLSNFSCRFYFVFLHCIVCWILLYKKLLLLAPQSSFKHKSLVLRLWRLSLHDDIYLCTRACICWYFREAVRPKQYVVLRQRSRQCQWPSAVPRRSHSTKHQSSSASKSATSPSPLVWRTSCSGLRMLSLDSWSEMLGVMPLMGSRWTGRITVIWWAGVEQKWCLKTLIGRSSLMVLKYFEIILRTQTWMDLSSWSILCVTQFCVGRFHAFIASNIPVLLREVSM